MDTDGNVVHSYPSNLVTALDWRKFAGNINKPSIRSAMHHYARLRGGAMWLRADGSLLVITLRENGKVGHRTYKPGTWQFERAVA